MAAASAPPLPRRPEVATQPAEDAIPDEPPPAYEATPAPSEQHLAYGPTRPYQPAADAPSPSTSYAPPPHPPPGHASPPSGSLSPQATGLGPPQFPFWNGANLTPQQTGFSEGPLRPLDYRAGAGRHSVISSSPYAPPPGPPPSHPSLPPASAHSSSPGAPQIPPLTDMPNPNLLADDRSNKYEPTSTPTPGQPYLNGGKLLVYPPGAKPCWKCSNTGYKPFELITGYRGDDPNHPCRKCWQKHSRPFSGPLALACRDATRDTIPANYQRPLRLLQTPATAPPRPQVTVTNGWAPRPPGAVVVRPGDPRMGGVLCRRCGGDGLVPGFLLFDEVTCDMCQGAGRVFL